MEERCLSWKASDLGFVGKTLKKGSGGWMFMDLVRGRSLFLGGFSFAKSRIIPFHLNCILTLGERLAFCIL